MKEYNIIAIITDKDFGFSVKKLDNPIIRYASRGILFDDSNNIAIINKQLKNEYKLPGGGIEQNETKEETFLREIYEETGCTAEIINIMGITIEEKSMTNFKQISYVFLGRVINKTNELHLTKKEELEKTIVLWKSFEEGLEKIKNSEKELVGSIFDSKYQSLFMVRRDAEILNYYQNNKQKILKQ